MSLSINDLNFHDAIIKGVNFDILSKEILIDVLVYPSEEVSVRSAAQMKLMNVQLFSMIADVGTLVNNKNSGNINYISVDIKKRKIAVHLIDGMVSVKYGDIAFFWLSG